MWRWTLETERSRETAVTWVAVVAWRQAVVFYGSLSCGGVERKARLPGEQGGWEGFGLYRDGAQGQSLPVGVGPDGDPVVDRGADELIESLTGLEVEVVAVRVAHEQARAFEQTGHPLADGAQQLRELGASRARCPTQCGVVKLMIKSSI